MEAVAVRGLPDCAVSAQRAWIVELVTANHEYIFFSWQQTFNWITDYESRITNHKSRMHYAPYRFLSYSRFLTCNMLRLTANHIKGQEGAVQSKASGLVDM